LTIFITLVHSACRGKSLKSKAVHFVDIYNDFGPISFLVDFIDQTIDDAATIAK